MKGIRGDNGSLRFTNNEYKKALEYKNDYVLSVVLNLNEIPALKTIRNPIENLEFKKVERPSKIQIEYQLISPIC